jgi:hypothetical protein
MSKGGEVKVYIRIAIVTLCSRGRTMYSCILRLQWNGQSNVMLQRMKERRKCPEVAKVSAVVGKGE